MTGIFILKKWKSTAGLPQERLAFICNGIEIGSVSKGYSKEKAWAASFGMEAPSSLVFKHKYFSSSSKAAKKWMERKVSKISLLSDILR